MSERSSTYACVWRTYFNDEFLRDRSSSRRRGPRRPSRSKKPSSLGCWSRSRTTTWRRSRRNNVAECRMHVSTLHARKCCRIEIPSECCQMQNDEANAGCIANLLNNPCDGIVKNASECRMHANVNVMHTLMHALICSYNAFIMMPECIVRKLHWDAPPTA